MTYDGSFSPNSVMAGDLLLYSEQKGPKMRVWARLIHD